MADPEQPVVEWLACDLVSGQVIADLTPCLATDGPLSRRIGTETTVEATVDLSGAPANWEAATEKGRAMLVALADTVPVWAGIVQRRVGGSDTTVRLSLVTAEGYLERRFVSEHDMDGQDTGLIAAAVLADADGTCLVIDSPATGATVEEFYTDPDADKTVLAVLQELSDAGGPEFTIDPAWNGDRIALVARVRPRLGAASAAVFTFPGDVTGYELTESYEDGMGATDVVAYGEGEGADRWASEPQVATALLAAGWPRYEHRYTPAQGIDDDAQLNAAAAGELAAIQTGTSLWAFASRASVGPRLGAEWGLGDTVTVQVISSPRHPSGVEFAGRVVAWEWDPRGDTVTPVLMGRADA